MVYFTIEELNDLSDALSRLGREKIIIIMFFYIIIIRYLIRDTLICV